MRKKEEEEEEAKGQRECVQLEQAGQVPAEREATRAGESEMQDGPWDTRTVVPRPSADQRWADTRVAAPVDESGSNFNRTGNIGSGDVERALASAQAALSSALLLPGTPRSSTPRASSTNFPMASTSPPSANASMSPRPLASSLRSSVDSALRTASDYFDAKVCEVLEPRTRSHARVPTTKLSHKQVSHNQPAVATATSGQLPRALEGQEAAIEQSQLQSAAEATGTDSSPDEGIPPSPDSHVSEGGWI